MYVSNKREKLTFWYVFIKETRFEVNIFFIIEYLLEISFIIKKYAVKIFKVCKKIIYTILKKNCIFITLTFLSRSSSLEHMSENSLLEFFI